MAAPGSGLPRRRLSPAAYRRITFLAVVLLAFIVVTGGAVRLTGSGLGCPKWPTCDTSVVQVGPSDIHRSIESVNRTITGLVSVIVILAVLGSLLRAPRRRDLVWLSVGLVVGVIAQIVLGGLVVLTHLNPYLVMQHFSVSMLLLLDAVVLHHRASRPDGPPDPARPGGSIPPPLGAVVPPDLKGLIRMSAVAAALVIVLGTVVTATGPHPGSDKGTVVERLPLSVHRVSQVHGLAVMCFLALVVFIAFACRRADVGPRVVRAVEVLLGAIVLQGAIGYTQYFAGVPVLLVGFHIAGATSVWIATLHLNLVITEPVPSSPELAPRSSFSFVEA